MSDLISGNRITIEGVTVGINTPKMTEQEFVGDEEVARPLPPYHAAKVYSVDDYDGCPDHWPKGTAKSGSFFFPIEEGDGLWLDFTSNSGHPKHVVALISVQGVNARTGQPMTDMVLEQYRTNCPVHGKPFGAERMCEDCGYKWPPQNYLTSAVRDPFWIDGWRRPGDKQVRQFFFTAQEALGVAKALIGDARTFNIGIAFYLSREDRPPPQYRSAYAGGPIGAPDVFGSLCKDTYTLGGNESWSMGTKGIVTRGVMMSSTGLSSNTKSVVTVNNASAPTAKNPHGVAVADHVETLREEAFLGEVEPSSQYVAMEIGAGAIIRQAFEPDPNPLDFYQEEPVAALYLNYANAAFVEDLVRRGVKASQREGFLDGIPVGMPPAVATKM